MTTTHATAAATECPVDLHAAMLDWIARRCRACPKLGAPMPTPSWADTNRALAAALTPEARTAMVDVVLWEIDDVLDTLDDRQADDNLDASPDGARLVRRFRNMTWALCFMKLSPLPEFVAAREAVTRMLDRVDDGQYSLDLPRSPKQCVRLDEIHQAIDKALGVPYEPFNPYTR